MVDLGFTGGIMGKSLTEMLRDSMKFDPQNDAEAQDVELTLTTIKTTFKEWLNKIGIVETDTSEQVRELLITLIDEPL